jgi:hypothetical protein
MTDLEKLKAARDAADVAYTAPREAWDAVRNVYAVALAAQTKEQTND